MKKITNSNPLLSALKKKWFFVMAVSLLLVIYGVTCVKKQLNSGNDFPIYYFAAKTMLSGESPYDVNSGLHGYVYLPFFALVLSPLTVFPLWIAIIIWYLINVLLSVVSIRLAVKILSQMLPQQRSYWTIIISLAITGQFFLYNLDLGQANFVILSVTLFAIHLFINSRGEFLPGFLIAVSSVIKPYSIILLLPFLFRGRWRFCIGIFSGFFISIILLPIILVGPNRTKEMMVDWHNKIVVPQQSGELQGSKIWDQSPQAALRRLVVDSTAFGHKKINLLSLSSSQFQTASRILQIGFFLLLLITWIISRKKDTTLALLVDLALGYCGMLTIFGFNLKAHFVVLLIPWAILISLFRLNHTINLPFRSVMKIILIISGFIILLSNPGIIGRSASNWVLAYSSITFGTLIVMIEMIITRVKWIPIIVKSPFVESPIEIK